MLSVVRLQVPDRMDISAELRRIADCIEFGEYGETESVFIMVDAEKIHLLGAGKIKTDNDLIATMARATRYLMM